MIKKLLFGAAYYPEHDSEEEWHLDANLMQEIGFNIIRVGEFCWNRMQKSDGTFTLDWLERLIELYNSKGIKVVLCTPTACPPIWVVEKYPDIIPVLPDGKRGEFGGRRHYSVFHPEYRRLSVEIATALAERFGKNPGVCGWHIDNEIGTYSLIDCSLVALKAFHTYVEQKYGSVDKLNKEWGLIFWNQEIERFDQLPSPTDMMTMRNPQYVYEYNKFCINGAAEFAYLQAEAIRKYATKEQWIVASCIPPIQNRLFKMQEERGTKVVDYVEYNNYPELMPKYGASSMQLDIIRGIGDKQKFLVLEQQTGSGHTTTGGLCHNIRRFWAWDAIIRGSLSINWFHWRRFRTGCEWRLASIIERDRKPRAIYNSIKSIIKEIRKVENIILSAKIVPDVYIYMNINSILAWDKASQQSFWLEIQLPDAFHNRYPMWFEEVRTKIYNPLSICGLTIDFIDSNNTNLLDPSVPLIIPEMDLCTEKDVNALKDFLEKGGTCICFPGVGERNEYAAHRNLPSPGILGDLFGVELEDYYPLPHGAGPTFDPAAGGLTNTELEPNINTLSTIKIESTGTVISVDIRHAEILKLKEAFPFATYTEAPYEKFPAISLRKIGEGKVYYLGAVPYGIEDAINLYKALLPNRINGITHYCKLKIISSGSLYNVYLNNTNKPIKLPYPIKDNITDTLQDTIASYDLIIERL